MSKRLKYSNNGMVRFENFAENCRRRPSEPIGLLFGKDSWRLYLPNESNETVVFPNLGFSFDPPKQWTFYFFFKVSNRDESRIYESEGKIMCENGFVPRGESMPISELLYPENGFLDNGALIVEYGLQIESYMEAHGYFGFVFRDQIFECEEKMNMISFLDMNDQNNLKFLHCHKQIPIFHSSYFKNDDPANLMISLPNHIDRRDFHKFLFIAHGVRVYFAEPSLIKMAKIAHFFNMLNVIRFCEILLIQNTKWLNLPFQETMTRVKYAIQFNMKHYLTRLLKTQHCSNRIEFSTWIRENLELELLSSGVMKMLAKKIFES